MFYNNTKTLLSIVCLTTAMVACANDHLQKVFWTPHLRTEFGSYLNEVLRQVKPKKFYKVIDSFKKEEREWSDTELYKLLLKHIDELVPRVQLYQQHKKLTHQKKILVPQAAQLIGDTKIDGYVEIGTPGTYINSIKKQVKLSGDFYVINDKQRMSDYFQSFSFNPLNKFVPYHHFVPLNNYDPITDIPESSVDLVTCFNGLHHMPKEKLANFIASIYRILRPGGIFLMREYDCINTDVESLIHTAHTVYNAVMLQEPLEAEIQKYRNFQKLDYWIDAVQGHGFATAPQRLLQVGDPTLNTLIEFVKVARTQDEQLLKISRALKEKKKYEKQLGQTYLNNSEWFNIDATHEYSEFIEHKPFYEFPHMNYIKSYWQTFGESYKLASDKKGHFKTIASTQMLKNLLVGLKLSAEYTAKSAIAAPIRWIKSNKKSETVQIIIKDPKDEINSLDIQYSLLEIFLGPDLLLIEVPRYNELLKLIRATTTTDISILEIAGQREIQLDVFYKKTDENRRFLTTLSGCKKEYEWDSPTKNGYVYAIITVQINTIKDIVSNLKTQGIDILHI